MKSRLHANLFKVKPGKLGQWKAWCEKIQNQLRDEAVKTLLEEGVRQEAAMLFELEGSHYVLGFMDADTLAPANEAHEINRQHRLQKKECLEKVSRVETLYYLAV